MHDHDDDRGEAEHGACEGEEDRHATGEARVVAAVERSLDLLVAPIAVHDQGDADQRERDTDHLERPAGAAGELRHEPAGGEADGKRREAGPPPGEVGALVGEPRAPRGVLHADPFAGMQASPCLGVESRHVFTVAQRDALREHLLQLAERDERVVAGAAVGSLAVDGGGDRFSDLDLTFAVVDEVPVAVVLDDWTQRLADTRGAVQLCDLARGATTYRVFLLPDALQFDLSMTPASQFRAGGPRFRLLFGEAGEPAFPTRPEAHDLFGWGVIYALHSRSCIERRRLWQAEHYIGAVRDHALALACLREGVAAVQARGYDDLSGETLARFADAHVAALEPEALRAALTASVAALVREGAEAQLPHAGVVAERLAEL
jgi:hypothetical protein